MSTQRTTRAQQKEAKQAAVKAAKARDERHRRIMTAVVVGTMVVVFGAVAAIAFRGGGTAAADANGVPYSADREAFRLPGLLDDTPVSLSDHAGTPVVVNFFASWCVYCNEELPGFTQVAQATSGQVDFVGVDTSDPGDGAAMARRFDLAGAGFALASDIGSNPPSDLWSSFGAQGLPVTAFYDGNGKLVDFSGGMLTQTELEQRIKDNFGVDVKAPDAAKLGAPVIPLIPRGAFELLRTHVNDPTFVAVDLRAAGEYARGHVPGAVNVDVAAGDVKQAVATLDKSASYFLYDASGEQAERVATALHDAGFKHVYYVEGGYAAWQNQGLPTSG